MRPHILSRTRQLTASRTTTSTRFFSADPPAASVAASFLSKFQSSGPQTRTQTLDANQLQLLSLTLNRPSLFPNSPSLSNAPNAPPPDTPVPPGYHLVYFTPAFLENELGADGTDASYNPKSPFTRRMWAGGEVLWPRGADGKPNLLRVGQEVRETTRVLSATPKVVKKTGEDMIVVGVEMEFSNEHGISVIDRRSVMDHYRLYVGSVENTNELFDLVGIGSSAKRFPLPQPQHWQAPPQYQPRISHRPRPRVSPRTATPTQRPTSNPR